ncbi:YfiR family protein [Fulvivirga sp. 29W222]|uniref:YfiR family protein n=2 Tax=Fulvivirga marina TaxID=2494733 RepID=A0A937FY16_9BACT|nr:YfiR family protein [Fulvivirga marina]
MMIYNFLKYIQWPGEKNTGDFVIGVMGDDEVFKTLNTWYGNKTRGDKTFTIKKLNSPSEISGCQLLYIGASASNQFDEIRTKVENQSVLTITNKSGLGAKGSCINFKVVDNRLKFELNQSAIEKSNLKISGQLTSMAILI